jgi:PAS domain S-box-containing protein
MTYNRLDSDFSPESGNILRNNLIATLVYLLVARLSLLLAFPGSNASPVWPPSGIALAFFLMYGYRIAPGIAVGAFVANLWTMMSGDTSDGYMLPLVVSLDTAIGNTLEAVVGFWLINKFSILTELFSRVRAVVGFTLIAFVMSLVSAGMGPVVYCMSNLASWDIYPNFFLTWWLGDATGIIIFAPAVYTLLSVKSLKIDTKKLMEIAVISVGLALMSLIVFRNEPNHILSLLMPYIFFPLIIWIAQKFNSSAAFSSIAVVSIIAVDGTVNGYGPFVKSSLNTSLLLLQGFVSILAFTSLSFAAATNERRFHENKAIKSANDLKAVFNVLPDLYFKFSKDGIIIDCYTTNPTFHLDDPEKIKNQSVAVLFPKEVLDEIMHSVFSVTENQKLKEVEYINKVEGKERDFEARLFYMEESEEVIAVIRDITQLRVSEREVRSEKNLLRTLIDNIPDAIYSKDTKLRKVLANPADLYNMHLTSEAEAIGKTDLDLHPKELADKFMADDRFVIESGNPIINREEYVLDENGEVIWLLTSKLPLRNETGKIVGLLGIGRNVTESVKAREEIKKLNVELEERVIARTQELDAKNKELEAFSYSVSHDLRAPLRHIGGFVELLQKKELVNLTEKGGHYLSVIAESTKQMGDLIDDLLQFSRTGRAEMRSSLLNINEMVKEVVELTTRDEHDRNIRWDIEPLPEVLADAPLIRQVWINLLSNAVKFSRKNELTIIRIYSIMEDTEIIFCVKDNGAGFDMRYSQKLFGVFQRLHSKDEFEGTGIGLANVQRIIQRHGGRVWAESEPGKGAQFFFSLPKKTKDLT